MRNIVIVWGNGLPKLDIVKKVITKLCPIISGTSYNWKEGKEFEGLTMFYDKNSKIIESKMKNCKTSEFVMLEIDLRSKQGYVLHREGILSVDLKVFNLKHQLRSIFDGKDFIHTSDSSKECNEQKLIIENYCLINDKSTSVTSLKDSIFYRLKDEEYVVLRNDSSIKYDIEYEGGDIDILCNDANTISKKLNLIQDKKYKSRYFLIEMGLKVQFDIRSVDSGYYDKNWAKCIINNRQVKNDYFIPSPQDHVFSFLYHIFFHKRLIREDHVAYFNILMQKYELRLDDPFKELLYFMRRNGYGVSMPADLSVPMNINLITENNLNKHLSLSQKLSNFKFNLRRKIKRVIYEIF